MKIKNYSWINKSRSVHVRIVLSIQTIQALKHVNRMRNDMLEYCVVSMKTMTFYKTSHPGSNSFLRVEYIVTTAMSLSIAVFIICFMLMEQFKCSKCSHY